MIKSKYFCSHGTAFHTSSKPVFKLCLLQLYHNTITSLTVNEIKHVSILRYLKAFTLFTVSVAHYNKLSYKVNQFSLCKSFEQIINFHHYACHQALLTLLFAKNIFSI